MYGKRLISKLAYGIHPTTPNQPPQDLVLGSLSPRPRGQSATRPGRTTELQNTGRGTEDEEEPLPGYAISAPFR